MAHITGGGLLDNIPRLFQSDLTARITKGSWNIPPIFELIQKLGNIDEQEMYRVFNMGVGMAVFCSPDEEKELLAKLPEAKIIGSVTEGKKEVVIS